MNFYIVYSNIYNSKIRIAVYMSLEHTGRK